MVKSKITIYKEIEDLYVSPPTFTGGVSTDSIWTYATTAPAVDAPFINTDPSGTATSWNITSTDLRPFGNRFHFVAHSIVTDNSSSSGSFTDVISLTDGTNVVSLFSQMCSQTGTGLGAASTIYIFVEIVGTTAYVTSKKYSWTRSETAPTVASGAVSISSLSGSIKLRVARSGAFENRSGYLYITPPVFTSAYPYSKLKKRTY